MEVGEENLDKESKKNKDFEAKETLTQKAPVPEEDLIQKLNTLAKTILFRSIKKEKKDDPL